jgi:hypothetical protein
MEKVKTEMKRNQLVDATTGRVDLRYNPLSLEEDYFIPMRGGVGSDIKTLAGAASLNDIDDVKYLRDKLFSAIKIPQAYLTNLEGASEDKTTLAQKDIRFARTITRLQRSIVAELEKMAIVHLYTLGYRGQDLLSFKITLNNPSRLAELQQLEYLKTKFDTATGVPEGTYSKRWIAHNILGMTDDEFLRNQRETFYDRKYQQALEGLAEEGAMDAAGGGMGDLGGEGDLGDLGGEGDLGDLGGEGDLDLGGEGEGDDTALLATPGRTEDNPRKNLHQGAKHKKVKVDHRRGSAEQMSGGPLRREMRRQARGPELGSTSRTKFPGKVSLAALRSNIRLPDFKSIVGLEEQEQPTYTDDETVLFRNTTKVRRLVEAMERKTDDETVLFRNTTKVRRLVETMERKEEKKNET